MTTPRPESTPEHLAHTTFFTLDAWQTAYNALGDRPDWPEIASWAVKFNVHPAALPGLLAKIEPRPIIDETTFDRIAEVGQMLRSPGRLDRGRVDENGPMLPAPGTQVKRLADVRLFEVYRNPPDYWPGRSQP